MDQYANDPMNLDHSCECRVDVLVHVCKGQRAMLHTSLLLSTILSREKAAHVSTYPISILM